MDLGDKKDQIEKDIMTALVPFQKGSRDLLSTVSIRPTVEEEMDWTEAPPFKKAIEDAELFLREGSYDSAFDRIQTALSDYIKQADVDDRTGAILRSAGEIVNTAAHTDGQQIGKRDAQLAIGLANTIFSGILQLIPTDPGAIVSLTLVKAIDTDEHLGEEIWQEKIVCGTRALSIIL